MRDAACASVKLKHHHSVTRKNDLPSLAKRYDNVTLNSFASLPNHTYVHRNLQSTELLTSTDTARLEGMGCLIGQNSLSAGSQAWIGSDGIYTNEFSNDSDNDLILIVWGVAASWVNVHIPLITISLPQQASQTISFASGMSGAWSAVYSDTEMIDGQIANTWGEYTFGETGVVDVSREVNMLGHPLSIVGPMCTANITTCVFLCTSGDRCTTDYTLQNCENGSQAGARYGLFGGFPTGGCGWANTSAALQTSFL